MTSSNHSHRRQGARTALMAAVLGVMLLFGGAGCSQLSAYIPDFDTMFGGPSAPANGTGGYADDASSNIIVATARTQYGVPYKWGGESPAEGFDCSGLTWWTYRQHGVALPRVSWQQYEAGYAVDRNRLAPGDLVFFRTGTGRSLHVGIYTEHGTFIHAPSSGSRVREDSLADPYWRTRYIGARRVLEPSLAQR